TGGSRHSYGGEQPVPRNEDEFDHPFQWPQKIRHGSVLSLGNGDDETPRGQGVSKAWIGANVIFAALCPGMTPDDPPKSKKRASDQAILLNGSDGVGGTGGVVAAHVAVEG